MDTYLAILIVEIDSIHQLAVNIELFVKRSAIAYANWLGVTVTGEMGELDLGEISVASNVEHDWKCSCLRVSGILQPIGDETVSYTHLTLPTIYSV